MKKVLLINGPNLGLLGIREPEVYGKESLEAIVKDLKAMASEAGFVLLDYQSDREGDIVSRIGEVLKNDDICGIVINPGAYAHTSIAIRDAVSAVNVPTIEVHMSNVFAREEFRHHSYLSPVCSGVIVGLGSDSYRLGLSALLSCLTKKCD